MCSCRQEAREVLLTIPPCVVSVCASQDNFLLQLLELCGKVESYKRLKNMGTYTFSRPANARKAVKLLDGIKVDYQEITVKLDKKAAERMATLNLPDDDPKDLEVGVCIRKYRGCYWS